MSRENFLAMRKKPQQTRSVETVNIILLAAAQVFSRQGYEKTTSDLIAERAGISIGSFYQYFPGKDAVLCCLLEDHISKARALVQSIQEILLKDDLDLSGAVRECLRLLFDHHTRELPLDRIINEEIPYPKHIKQSIDAMQEGLVNSLASFIELSPQINKSNPKQSARLIVDLVESSTHRFFLSQDNLEEISEYTRELEEMICSYLLK